MCYDKLFKLRVIECYNTKKYSIEEILQIFQISNGSLYNWIHNYNNNISLERKQKDSKVAPIIKCYIREYIIKHIVFNYRNILKLINKNYNVSISKSTLYSVISSLNITRKRIRKRFIYMKNNKYKSKVKQFKKTINRININRIISIDETNIDTHMYCSYGWSSRGQQITMVKRNLKKRYTLISAITTKRIFHNKILDKSANAISFLDFIKELIMKLKPNEKYYLLIDNARIHHAKILKEYIKDISNIEMIYNVAYSPEYNPIERVFSTGTRCSIRPSRSRRQTTRPTVRQAAMQPPRFAKIRRLTLPATPDRACQACRARPWRASPAIPADCPVPIAFARCRIALSLVQLCGGTPETEAAVKAALKWLAHHQSA